MGQTIGGITLNTSRDNIELIKEQITLVRNFISSDSCPPVEYSISQSVLEPGTLVILFPDYPPEHVAYPTELCREISKFRASDEYGNQLLYQVWQRKFFVLCAYLISLKGIEAASFWFSDFSAEEEYVFFIDGCVHDIYFSRDSESHGDFVYYSLSNGKLVSCNDYLIFIDNKDRIRDGKFPDFDVFAQMEATKFLEKSVI